MARQSQQPSLEALASELRIDLGDLESANQEQAELYWRVAERVAILTDQRDTAKNDLADVEAQEDLRFRSSIPSGEKVTEKEIASNVARNIKVIAARNRHQELCGELIRWTKLEYAYSQRMSALKRLVDLHLKSYNSAITRQDVESNATKVRDAKAASARVQLKKQREELTR